jgi:hypothetical protein
VPGRLRRDRTPVWAAEYAFDRRDRVGLKVIIAGAGGRPIFRDGCCSDYSAGLALPVESKALKGLDCSSDRSDAERSSGRHAGDWQSRER